MSYEDLPLWHYCANAVDFRPSYGVEDTPFGKQPISTTSPHWMFDMSMPAKNMMQRREVEALLHSAGGATPFRVYDDRVAYPAHYDKLIKAGANIKTVPDVHVLAVSKTNGSLTVRGDDCDVITQGDPLAFTHSGRRFYFKSLETLTLTGADQDIRVFIRPDINATGLDIVTERVRPTQAFVIDINGATQRTESDHFTRPTLRGVEYWGPV